jgi:hypothetical protein
MELVLLSSEDVHTVTEPTIETSVGEEPAENAVTIKEFEISDELKELLSDIHTLAIGGMDVQGYKSYTAGHPVNDYEVIYYVKGITVIMVDYHGTNTLTVQVLGRKDTEWFINNVKDAFGIHELNN